MKEFSYYENIKVKYPVRADYTTTYYYKNGEVVGVKKPNEPTPSVEYKVMEVVFDDESYGKDYNKYYESVNKMTKEFKTDLLEDLGIIYHPKADKIFDKAWQQGRSDGLYRVVEIAEDLADLLD